MIAAESHSTGGVSKDLRQAGDAGPAPVDIVVSYGFWIFLLSDIVMFSAFFAAYAVLSPQTAGGPRAAELFDLTRVAAETLCLLFSSYTCGLASWALQRRRFTGFYLAIGVTFALGVAFLAQEYEEFLGLISRGAGPSRSAFLSAFFSLVGMHGLHVAAGLIWMAYLTAQLAIQGARSALLRRSRCFALFWHALDIVWIGVMSLVYLGGMR